MKEHSQQWNQIQTALRNKRVPQALLFVGPTHCGLTDFVSNIIRLFFCTLSPEKVCMECTACQMISRMEHPDIEWIKPEKAHGPIKIDQIRELQNSVYLTPQRSAYRFIVIEDADRMNTAAANALLKVLEEPASHTLFILMAQQLSTVLPTVISRCQLMTFSAEERSYAHNLLLLGEYSAQDPDRVSVMEQAELILENLISIIDRKEHPCKIASQWSQYELGTLLWFLYLVYSQLQYRFVTHIEITKGPAHKQLERIFSLVNPLLIFKQIDKINILLKKLSHNMNINQNLVLEDLLFSLNS